MEMMQGKRWSLSIINFKYFLLFILLFLFYFKYYAYDKNLINIYRIVIESVIVAYFIDGHTNLIIIIKIINKI